MNPGGWTLQRVDNGKEKQMNRDPERLRRLAEQEDGCPIGVGGMPLKILFLDIDGVLNSSIFIAQEENPHAISSEMVAHINRVIEATSCKIVISSTWRLYWPLGELKAILRQHGLIDVIIDKTPDLGSRDMEILSWLRGHQADVTAFAVVDDNIGDLHSVKDRLVATSFVTGATQETADKLIELLNG